MKIKSFYNNIFHWKFLTSLLISIIASFYAFNDFKIGEIFEIIYKINFIYIILAVLLLLLSVYIRSLRWKLLFSSNHPLISHLFGSQLVGYFGNNIFPMRAGELLRCVFLSRQYKIPQSKIFGTVILERFLDMFGIISLIFFAIYFLTLDIFNQNLVIFFFIPLVFLLFCLLMIYAFKFSYIGNSKILSIINNILTGFKSLDYKNILPITIYTILIWSIYILMVYLVQYSINLNLSLNDVIVILIISSLALSVPSAPANIGTFEWSVIYAMKILDISLYQQEFAIILHLTTFIPYTILGGIFFIYYNYSILDKE